MNIVPSVDTKPFKKRFIVAQPGQKKKALDVSKLSIYPPRRMFMSIKTFEANYVAHLEEALNSLASFRDRMGIIVEIMSLYEETNKPDSQVVLRTTDNFVSVLAMVANGLNTFYHNNSVLIDTMYKMLYGEELQVKKLSTDKDLEKAEADKEKKDTLSELVEES